MTSPLDKLNLRPFEKRLVVGILVVVFLVVNAWVVFPHFSDWSNVQGRMSEAREKLAKWQGVAAEEPKIRRLVDELQKQSSAVPPEEQTFQFTKTILQQAQQSGVNIVQTGKIFSETNQFFLLQTQSISVTSGEQQLVDFLFNLGSGDSLIRVRDLSLRPDPPRQSLSAGVKLVGSYQKKTPGKAAPAARKTAAASSPTPDYATVTSIAK
jgi:Tfp pilus assembly protein PilO